MRAGEATDERPGPEGTSLLLGLLLDRLRRALARLDAQRRQLRRLRRQLIHVGRVSTVGELTASLAHELSQPLTAILSNAQAAERLLAAEAPNLGEIRAILGDIVADDQRATAVIHRLRALLRDGGGEAGLVDVNELVVDATRLVGPDAALRRVTLRVDLAPGLPLVRGDRVQLQQVLLNLMLNGLDAIREAGGPGGELSLRTGGAGGEVTVAVHDSGGGIEPARLERIFEAFHTTKPDGLGMGLAIARAIARRHRGCLRADSAPGGGATLRLTLPAGDA
jgi:signal transduction histidine kinase